MQPTGGATGPFWQRESYDHWVHDLDELERIIAYVEANPVKAGLIKAPEDWPFSSAPTARRPGWNWANPFCGNNAASSVGHVFNVPLFSGTLKTCPT